MVTPVRSPLLDCFEFGQAPFCLIQRDRFQGPIPGTGNSTRQIQMKLQTNRGLQLHGVTTERQVYGLSWTDFGTNLKCATIWGIT
jgi:hypothetical protein